MAETIDTFQRTARRRTGLKLLAMALAFLTWYAIREETSYEQTIRGVSVDVRPPAGWQINAQSADTVDVLFRGSRSDLRGLTREDVRIESELARAEAARTNVVVKLAPRHVRAPAGMRALRVVPSSIFVRLEPRPQG